MRRWLVKYLHYCRRAYSQESRLNQYGFASWQKSCVRKRNRSAPSTSWLDLVCSGPCALFGPGQRPVEAAWMKMDDKHYNFQTPGSADMGRSSIAANRGDLEDLQTYFKRANSITTQNEPRWYTPSLCVFSGGSAFNDVVKELNLFTDKVTHIIPVSDDGGSTSEIVKFLGGPAIGDIRSRCLRLSDQSSPEARAVATLLGHRLHATDRDMARLEFYSIVEGHHALWTGVSEAYKHTIRSFLTYFFNSVLRDAKDAQNFNYCNGSVGNFFFTGARMFFRSMEAAIFLYARVSGCPSDSLVLPSLRTNNSVVIGAELQDGSIIRGQSEISHPAAPDASTHVNKDYEEQLPSPIKKIFYMTSESSEVSNPIVFPANPAVVKRIIGADAIVYGMGSFYTSIMPSLVLKGMGEAISSLRGPKILLVNGSWDRETYGMSVSDMIRQITAALNGRMNVARTGRKTPVIRRVSLTAQRSDSVIECLSCLPSAYVTCVLIPKDSEIPIDIKEVKEKLGVRLVMVVESELKGGKPLFKLPSLVSALRAAWAISSGAAFSQSLKLAAQPPAAMARALTPEMFEFFPDHGVYIAGDGESDPTDRSV